KRRRHLDAANRGSVRRQSQEPHRVETREAGIQSPDEGRRFYARSVAARMTHSGVGKLVWALLPAMLCAQNFNQRGFIETDLTLYPETAPNDSGQAVDDSLFRYEASYKALPWLRLAGSFDARFDTHEEVERTGHLDWQ